MGEETVLVLRTCAADLSSYGGFRWPASGPVAAPDWDPAPRGYRGTATAGYRGTATAGYRGTVAVRRWDFAAGRYRLVVGYIGEDGLLPDVAYRLNDSHQLVAVETPVAAVGAEA